MTDQAVIQGSLGTTPKASAIAESRTWIAAATCAKPTPNQSRKWTSTSWPRYAQQFIIASRGQPVLATQLQRLRLGLSDLRAWHGAI